MNGTPFARVFTEGGSPAPGSYAAFEDALDELFPADDEEAQQ